MNEQTDEMDRISYSEEICVDTLTYALENVKDTYDKLERLNLKIANNELTDMSIGIKSMQIENDLKHNMSSMYSHKRFDLIKKNIEKEVIDERGEKFES